MTTVSAGQILKGFIKNGGSISIAAPVAGSIGTVKFVTITGDPQTFSLTSLISTNGRNFSGFYGDVDLEIYVESGSVSYTSATFVTESLTDVNGNYIANIIPRTGLLADLLTYAGGNGELASATDADTIVKFNGVVGGARAVWASSKITKEVTVSGLTATPLINCSGVRFLRIIIPSTNTVTLASINIQLGDSSVEEGLDIEIHDYSYGLQTIGLVANLTLHANDIASAYGFVGLGSDTVANQCKFIDVSGVVNLGLKLKTNGGAGGWARVCDSNYLGIIPMTTPQVGSIGEVITAAYSTPTLTSGVANHAAVLTLTPGVWMVQGAIGVTSTNATALALSGLVGESNNVLNGYVASGLDVGAVKLQTAQSLANGSVFGLALPPRAVYVSSISQTWYANLMATFSAGTCTANAVFNATRIA